MPNHPWNRLSPHTDLNNIEDSLGHEVSDLLLAALATSHGTRPPQT
jgi:hypothetical protein